ncbi:hypothetical protein [Bradyrhizobium sp. SYSU BS000235]|uniref:hypothetical protein n=1 Tax=Bradyrhizobium sp. SYSU BS000235 TaxID=3411332 RepID=UPI003C74EAA1
MTAHHTLWMVWRWPLLLAALTVFGLLAALIGQSGLWWPASWIALAMPLIVIVRAVCAAFRPHAA